MKRSMIPLMLAAMILCGSIPPLRAQVGLGRNPEDMLRGAVRVVSLKGGLYTAKKGGKWSEEAFLPIDTRELTPAGVVTARTTHSYRTLTKGGLLRTVIYSLDSVALESRRTIYGAKGELVSTETTTMERVGHPTELQVRDRAGVLTQTSTYRYDPDGNLAEISRYNGKQVFEERTGYGYDFRGRATEVVEYNSIGDVRRRIVNSYDSRGALTEVTEFDFTNHGVDSMTQVTYGYDSLGRLDRVRSFNASAYRYTGGDFQPRLVRETSYTYGADGELAGMSISDPVAGYEEKVVFQNDTEGNWIRKDHYRRPIGDAGEFTPHEAYARTIVYYTS